MKISSRLASGVVLVGILATAQVLTGCGLKGPLYRPGERTQKDSTASPATGNSSKPPMSQRAPAPQAQKNDSTAPTATTPAVDPDRPADPPAGTP